MIGWLTRRHNGDYLLTRARPFVCKVAGTDYEDAYPKPGEPVGVQMCASGVHQAMGTAITIGETIRVEYNLRPTGGD